MITLFVRIVVLMMRMLDFHAMRVGDFRITCVQIMGVELDEEFRNSFRNLFSESMRKFRNSV
jgi:hypothetical protein